MYCASRTYSYPLIEATAVAVIAKTILIAEDLEGEPILEVGIYSISGTRTAATCSKSTYWRSDWRRGLERHLYL